MILTPAMPPARFSWSYAYYPPWDRQQYNSGGNHSIAPRPADW